MSKVARTEEDELGSAFGMRSLDPEQEKKVAATLKEDLCFNQISERRGPGGTRLKYLEHQNACNIANETFGYAGWSCVVQNSDFIYVTEKKGRWDVACKVQSYVQLENGARHTDVGWGEASNLPNRGDAMEKALKSAVSDARKRCLRVFGPLLGGCLYDKNFTSGKKARQQKAAAAALAQAEAASTEDNGNAHISSSNSSGGYKIPLSTNRNIENLPPTANGHPIKANQGRWNPPSRPIVQQAQRQVPKHQVAPAQIQTASACPAPKNNLGVTNDGPKRRRINSSPPSYPAATIVSQQPQQPPQQPSQPQQIRQQSHSVASQPPKPAQSQNTRQQHAACQAASKLVSNPPPVVNSKVKPIPQAAVLPALNAATNKSFVRVQSSTQEDEEDALMAKAMEDFEDAQVAQAYDVTATSAAPSKPK